MRLLALSLMLCGLNALAEDIATEPTPAEVGRYQLVRTSELTMKVDTRTGASWLQCLAKKSKLPAWCRVKDRSPYPSGPVGRYRVVEGAPMMLIDTVSGRSWIRCDDPTNTAEKLLSWCAIED